MANSLKADDESHLRTLFTRLLLEGKIARDNFGMNPFILSLETADTAIEEIGLSRECVLAIMLKEHVSNGAISMEEVESQFGEDVKIIISGLIRIRQLYEKSPAIETENFRNLLLSFAEDMRVILVMIADRAVLMRNISSCTNVDDVARVAQEASYLYAPLAHKLGLYKVKSELEDLSLKYLEHDAYYMIKEKLSQTKRDRDAYIESFIGPIKEKLESIGLKFHMKGRTKSIHSIWQKMKKQKCGFEGIYDLFAIRIILDSPEEQEKMQCWQVYSIITDMYQPNPKRLRDWLSVPKSNGYESLHITVLGPQSRWVEVQIRTERMDLIAERGLAAHWRYKGIKSSESSLEKWLAGIRQMLEQKTQGIEVMNQFKMDLEEDEVYVFTPKGDLLKFPKGSTILDFAYHVHSRVGNQCVGGKVGGKAVTMRYELQSGDQVEVLTSEKQHPKRDWLSFVKSSRSKSKIRQALRETQVKDGLYAKEMIERRLKNRKLQVQEGVMSVLIKKMGFKEMSEFYKQLANEKIDIEDVIELYESIASPKSFTQNDEQQANATRRSAEEFSISELQQEETRKIADDVLVIDRDLKGIDYSLARCCQPIYGDDIFGFVTSGGGIKVHRTSCPNAPQLRERFGYRVVRAQWSGKGQGKYSITLRIVGNDDIGIVNNITSIISKEEKIEIRNIAIDSHDGLFSGNLSVSLDDTSRLEKLIQKLRTVKGVKNVSRI